MFLVLPVNIGMICGLQALQAHEAVLGIQTQPATSFQGNSWATLPEFLAHPQQQRLLLRHQRAERTSTTVDINFFAIFLFPVTRSLSRVCTAVTRCTRPFTFVGFIGPKSSEGKRLWTGARCLNSD